MANRSVDDFLNHRGSTNQRAKFFSWRKNGAGTALIWLHTQVIPVPLWFHGFPKIVVLSNEKTRQQETRIWGERYVCHEPEDVLKKYKRDRDDDSELTHCGMCRFAAWVRRQVKAGKIDLTKELFRFQSDKPDESRVLHAGGIAGLFNASLDEAQKEKLAAARISLKNAWGENAMAKLNYLFVIADEGDAAAGLQVAIEAELLGDKVKKVIHDARRSDGSEEGDPFRHPYAIEWEANGAAKEIQKKYDARMMRKIKLTPGIKSLITGPVPSLASFTKPFDQLALRSFLEHHCLLKGVPWDDIFDTKSTEEPAYDDAVGDESGSGDFPLAAEESGPAPAVSSVATDDEMYECEVCGKGSPDPATCVHCGAKYGEDGSLAFDPRKKAEEPKLRKRGGAAAPKSAPAVEPPKDVTPKGFKPNPPGEAGDDSDPLPWG